MRLDQTKDALREILGKDIVINQTGSDLTVMWSNVEGDTQTFRVKNDLGDHWTVFEKIDGEAKRTTASHLLTQAVNLFKISGF